MGSIKPRRGRPTIGKMVRRRIAPLLLAALVTGCGAAAHPETSGRQTARLVAPAAQPRVAADTDPEAAKAFPLPAGVNGVREAPTPDAVPAAPRAHPAAALTTSVSPGAPSDDQIRAELRQMDRVLHRLKRAARRPGLTTAGRVQVPDGVPAVLASIFAGGNAIARFPYVYGGGHASFVDTAYDCSASVSYALAAAGLLNAPLTSGQLARWGAPGPGKWVTIYANAGHTFMYVDGLRFDTSGRAGPFGSRWQTAPRSLAGFTVRHPPGL
jgi:cell wall-associated NlpC family hydrolase